MAKPIKITVKGSNNHGDDAPTVEDLLTQIQDYVSILREVEDALAKDGAEQIVWRVTDVMKNSPLTFEVTPYAKTYGMNIDARAEKVVIATAAGFKRLTDTCDRPMYFTEKVINKAEKIYGRVTNGLSETSVNFSEYEGAPNFKATPNIAHKSVAQIKDLKNPADSPHRELGSLEGFINKIELDGFGRPIVWLRSRLDGQTVKCISSDGGLDRIGHFEVDEVLRGLRIQVHGMINYKDLEHIATIDVEAVHVFEPDENLPNFDSIVDPEFTGGLESSAYLEALRNGA